MADIIKGRFYFKQTTNGNLIGEWSNYETEPATESSDFQGEFKDVPFVGTYFTTWQEKGMAQFYVLEITKVTKPINSKKFDLKWINKKQTLTFTGQAMLCDNILIGDYNYCGKP
ncbi:MAG: hypothetical protein P4N60_18475 [Verrucomicrobiae bacterium]|nr:hypothetical protein [Verrucomicrobiae bacterium]